MSAIEEDFETCQFIGGPWHLKVETLPSFSQVYMVREKPNIQEVMAKEVMTPYEVPSPVRYTKRKLYRKSELGHLDFFSVFAIEGMSDEDVVKKLNREGPK